MDREFMTYYNRELQYIRHMAGEFAEEFPKIAGRLGLSTFECTDPYVERLLEGFAFMAARIQLKFDSGFPRFTESLLQTVCPHVLAPQPAMCVAQFEPDHDKGTLLQGVTLDRGTRLTTSNSGASHTPCIFKTTMPLTIWPIELADASYETQRLGMMTEATQRKQSKAAIRIKLRAGGGRRIKQIKMDHLMFYLRGSDEMPSRIYEQLFSSTTHILVGNPDGEKHLHHLDKDNLQPVGLSEDETMMPVYNQRYYGFRLIQDYFAFPQKYQFARINGLEKVFSECNSSEIEILIMLKNVDVELERSLGVDSMALYCVPVINLFEKRADRIPIRSGEHEYHVVADRGRPMDYEIYSVSGLEGYGALADERVHFKPFYEMGSNASHASTSHAYFTTHRRQRVMSEKQRSGIRRSGYLGTEVFVTLVDPENAPFESELQQLGANTLCTNRDLPLLMRIGNPGGDFDTDSATPTRAINCISGPSKPQMAPVGGRQAWRAISHLTLNYLSLTDTANGRGVDALREILRLYSGNYDSQSSKMVDGLVDVNSKPIMRRLPSNYGHIGFARGLEITLTFDEDAFAGTGCFLIGAVLSRFLRDYVSLNSFVETVIVTRGRGEIMRWPAMVGQRSFL